MSKKPLSLNLHKSQLERQRRKEARSEMVQHAKDMGSGAEIVAYAIVGLTADGMIRASWDTGGVVPMWAFPATVGEALAADMSTSDVEEDFRKHLLDRAWRGSK